MEIYKVLILANITQNVLTRGKVRDQLSIYRWVGVKYTDQLIMCGVQLKTATGVCVGETHTIMNNPGMKKK